MSEDGYPSNTDHRLPDCDKHSILMQVLALVVLSSTWFFRVIHVVKYFLYEQELIQLQWCHMDAAAYQISGCFSTKRTSKFHIAGTVTCNNPPGHKFESPQETRSDETPCGVCFQPADIGAVSKYEKILFNFCVALCQLSWFGVSN